MHSRVQALIAELALQPHPEGGYYREIFRSEERVQPFDPRPPRAAVTSIYFLLAAGQQSRWHRVRSDEIWHFYEGDPLEICWIDGSDAVHVETLSAGASGTRPVRVVPARCWQTARPTGEYSLVGCTVGPGFDFDDFEMIDERSEEWARIRQLRGAPDWSTR